MHELSQKEMHEVAGGQYAPPVDYAPLPPWPVPPCPEPAPSPGGGGRPRELLDFNP